MKPGSPEQSMRVFCVAAVIALLAGPAFAQSDHVPKYGEAPAEKSAQEIESEQAAEKAYKNSLGNIPDKGPSDPWGSVRRESPPKDVTRNAQSKRIKPGSSAN
jgi:hypothetical protein